MPVFIEINNLTMDFGGKAILKDINLTIDEGEVIGIIGRSGAGKTTLMHLLRGIKEHEVTSGEVIYHIAHCSCGQTEPPSKVGTECPVCGEKMQHIKADLTKLEKHDKVRRSIANRIAIMLQRTFALYGDERVITNVMNALIEIGYSNAMSAPKAAELIDRVRMSHRMMHVARELSGGEKQRVVLARQLAKSPMVLLADEPTGTLDPKTAEIVHQSIMEAKKDFNMTVIITSHWSNVIEGLCDRAVYLEDGEVKEIGEPKRVVAEFLKEVGTVNEKKSIAGEPIVRVSHASKKYMSIDRGIVRALNDVSFEVAEGEILGIVGVSGAGKTTLSKILMGQLSPTKESVVDVRVGDEWIDMKEKGPMNLGRATKYMGLLHQEYALYPHRTVLDNLTESIGLDLPGELGERKVIKTLSTTGFTEEKAIEILDKYPHELSQGEDHRVAMAQILIKEPRIVLLDEPTGTMDPATRVDVSNSILRAREETGETFIIISHDMDFVVDVCDRAILMRGGKIIKEGLPEDVLRVLTEGERKEMVKTKSIKS